MSKATNDFLEQLHGAVAKELIARIEAGDAKASDLAVAVRFLSDNGVRNIVGDDKAALKDELKKLLPFKSVAQLADDQALLS